MPENDEVQAVAYTRSMPLGPRGEILPPEEAREVILVSRLGQIEASISRIEAAIDKLSTEEGTDGN